MPAPARQSVRVEGLSAMEYWKLQQRDSFKRYMAAFDGNDCVTLSERRASDENGDAIVTRVTKYFALHNPVPANIRKIVGMGNEFFFTTTDTFWPDRTGVDHKCSFTTEPP
eukprot:7387010-Prymnesium_polylepis.1